MKFYDEITKGFYDDTVHKSIPGNSIQVSDELHSELLKMQSLGKQITVVNGCVVNTDYVPTLSELTDAKIKAAKKYLLDTDFYFTVDKYSQLSVERKTELSGLREAARVVIRSFEDNM